MPDALAELFRPQAISALVQRYRDQAENRSWSRIYEEGETILANVDGTFKFDELRYSRDLAPIAGQDSPSTSTKKLIPKPRTGQVFLIQEHHDLPMRFLEGFRAPGSDMANAAMVIDNHVRNLTNKVLNTTNHWAAQSLLTQGGTVDLGAFPNSLLPAGSNLVYPVQDLDALANWDLAATKIRSSEINRLKKNYTQNAGFKSRRVQASSDVEGHITGNDEVSSFFTAGSAAAQIQARSFEERGIGDVIPFGGLQWNFVEDYHALDSAPDTPVDTNSDADVFAVLPGPERSFDAFAVALGVEYVPVGPIAGTIAGAPGNVVRPVRGMGGYIEYTNSPKGVRLVVFWTGCYVQKMPNAVMVFDSTP